MWKQPEGTLPDQWQNLQIQGLTFSYYQKGKGELHLENVSMDIKRGEKLGILGLSGSGKSTLLKVMRNLFDPQGLVLCVDGVPRPLGFADVSGSIALIPQSPEAFATTIWKNITFGASYDSETVRRTCDLACFTEVVERLPERFESLIKEKGVSLSGGQLQRMALARGLLTCVDKEIILLDESTSGVDSVRENRIYNGIFSEYADKTVLVSTHHLHLLPMFDRIYVFKNGRLVGVGQPEELRATCPEFQELWKNYTEHGPVESE